MTTKDDDTQAEQDVIALFNSSIGQGSCSSVKTWQRNETTKKKEYIGKRNLINNDFDQFQEDLHDDYPGGGEFYLQPIKATGEVITQGVLNLARKPGHDKVKANGSQDAPRAANDPMQMMLMQMQQDRQASQDMNRTIITGLVSAVTTGLAAAIPKMFDRKQSSDSPLELLNGVMGLQQKLNPPKPENSIKDLVDTVAALKSLMPEGGGDSGGSGLLGLVEKFAPMLQMMLEQQMKAPAQGAQPITQAQPRQIAQQAPGPQPMPQAQPGAPQVDQGAAVDQFKALLFQKYGLVMGNIKKLLDKGNDPSTILNYIDIAIDTEQVSKSDLDLLFSSLETATEQQVRDSLADFAIVDPGHVEIIYVVIGILSGRLDDDGNPRDGMDGDQAGAPGHGTVNGHGVGVATGTAPSPGAH